ncbi:hypothetical protein EUGRSUZ_F02766 [Eucalyptus grandis]|uniref:Uncharacterized protein n=2 Tax=Eucalyptus grandis TaxID=71139 RepID=A0ACC3KL52_EUCGR|nr:hypothetical protein EUGRSUZ_F02766 [Eucalyptus grandis]
MDGVNTLRTESVHLSVGSLFKGTSPSSSVQSSQVSLMTTMDPPRQCQPHFRIQGLSLPEKSRALRWRPAPLGIIIEAPHPR